MERESMAFDVVIVGAGPSGLACACRLMQLSNKNEQPLTVCVVEKGSEVGAHIISGAVLETTALSELFPEWAQMDAPIKTKVTEDKVFYLSGDSSSMNVPHILVPKTMRNEGNYIVSMGNVCRWLADQAESLGVEIFAGFPAQDVFYNSDGSVGGVITGDMGLDSSGKKKDGYAEGMILNAKYTVFAEGARGHLGKQLIEKFDLASGKEEQHYAIGFKEVWDIPEAQHQEGLVVHTAGWPLDGNTGGGGYLYHGENNQVFVGIIINLNYKNPYLDPFEEFQQYKHHPKISKYLTGGTRVSYGARAITKGGFNALPKMTMPGALLVGCDAGTINFAKIKGNHTAMKSGMIAAETICDALFSKDAGGNDLIAFETHFSNSWLKSELFNTKNFGAALQAFGPLIGGTFNWIDQNIFSGKLPAKFSSYAEDYQSLSLSNKSEKLVYKKPDGKISFDKLSSVFLSNTHHEEDQPCHLVLTDKRIPLTTNLPQYAEPALRYCPAGVYEIIEDETANGEAKFVINSQNCIHCKTCDIKDPSLNITWTAPEGGGGPNYPNM